MPVRKSVILGGLCFLLLNCTGIGTDREISRGTVIGPAPSTSVEQTPWPHFPVAKHESAPAPRPKNKPIGFSVNPETLLNLPEYEIIAKMGAPSIRREEPPAIIWSYLRGECRLDIYLYESLSTQVLRSLTYVVMTTRKDMVAQHYCLARAN